MQEITDYYRVLQVDPDASSEVIEAAYKRLAKGLHPDSGERNKESAHEDMVRLNQAYQVLSDPDKRNAYDQKRKKFLLSLFLNEGLLGLYRHIKR